MINQDGGGVGPSYCKLLVNNIIYFIFYQQVRSATVRLAKIHHQVFISLIMEIGFGITLDTIKMLDARRRGATTEAYE